MMTGMGIYRVPAEKSHEIRLRVNGGEISKILIILDNGTQRLITLILPRQGITLRDLLDQVGIQIGANRYIECIENLGSLIDYIIKVGKIGSRETTELLKSMEKDMSQNIANIWQELKKTKSPSPKYAECCGGRLNRPKCERCHQIYTEDP